MSLFQIILPEIILVTAACALFLLGFAGQRNTGRLAATLGLLGVVGALGVAVMQYQRLPDAAAYVDRYANFRVSEFGLFVRVIALSVAALLLMLSWPFGVDSTGQSAGNASVHYGRDAGEYFGLMLLAFTGLILVPSANDIMVLFMAIELASIPTYVLVSISRPVSVAQEAGVKYFFLGAMAAAVMLMGFAYLYGTTGTTDLHEIADLFARNKTGPLGAPATTPWQLLAGMLIVIGVGFKLAAVPMHAYVADVYQGAATPVTAILGFVPKSTGILALIKILFVFSGATGAWTVAPQLGKLVWIVAVLTMTVGNLLALLQSNVKRLFAYSSVAHSGYLLAGLAVVLMGDPQQRQAALTAVLFYLASYGVTSTAAFGALMMIPSRQSIRVGDRDYLAPATTAETMDDLAGVGRSRPVVALLLAIGCFSLTGLPLTGGFWGKYYLLAPIFSGYQSAIPNSGWMLTLAIVVLVNSAISAAYYLGVVGALFNRSPIDEAGPSGRPLPILATTSITLCVAIILFLGIALVGTQLLSNHAAGAALALDANPRPTAIEEFAPDAAADVVGVDSAPLSRDAR